MRNRTVLLAFLVLNAAALGYAAETNQVANGSFEHSQSKAGVPGTNGHPPGTGPSASSSPWIRGATASEWFPQISTEGVKNFVPNSSFECGTANWGSFTYGLSGWAGNLYRLEGEADGAVAQHGQHSLKIALTPETLPVFYFDYYDPVRQPVRRVLAANRGWFRVKPGRKADALGLTSGPMPRVWPRNWP